MATVERVSVGSDHAGFALKEKIRHFLESKGYEVTDHGCFSEASVDYPDFAHALSQSVESGKTQLGFLVCGSGNGVCITANKYAGIRAALAWNEEIAKLARLHNDANVLCMGARFISDELAIEMVEDFLATDFEGGRHQRRVEKIVPPKH